MSIENWSDHIILVKLQREPDLGDELQSVCEIITEKKSYNIVVDFSDVEIITSSSIAKLLRLRKLVYENQRQLLLSSVGAQTRSIFSITGLDTVFNFTNDQFSALAGLQMAEQR